MNGAAAVFFFSIFPFKKKTFFKRKEGTVQLWPDFYLRFHDKASWRQLQETKI